MKFVAYVQWPIFVLMEYNMEIVKPWCSCSMAIVVLALWPQTIMAIERLHLGTTISIEHWHSVIIMFHYGCPS